MKILLLLSLMSWFGAVGCKAKFRSTSNGASDSSDSQGADDQTGSPQDVDSAGTGDGTGTTTGTKSIKIDANGTEDILSIQAGDTVKITWVATGYVSCEIAALSESGLTGEKDLGALSADQIIEIICKDQDDAEEKKTIEVKIEPTNTGPTINIQARVVGDPSYSDGPLQVDLGSNIELSWTSSDATECTVTPGNLTGLNKVEVINNMSQSVVYVLSCDGVGGSNQDSIEINIKDALKPLGDLKVNGSSTSLVVSPGAEVSLDWSSENATSCGVTPGNFSGTSGSNEKVIINQQTAFELLCVGSGNQTFSMRVTVHLDTEVTGTADLKINGDDGPVDINYGDDLTLSWSSTNATDCEVSTSLNQKFLGTSGSQVLQDIDITQTYTLVCSYAQGKTVFDYATVRVRNIPVPSGKITANGKLDQLTIDFGDPVAIAWESTDASECKVTPGDFTGVDSSQVVQNMTNTTTFVLSCTGPGGVLKGSVVVNVLPDPNAGDPNDPNGCKTFQCFENEVAKICGEKTHQTQTIQVSLPRTTACAWNQNDNLDIVAGSFYKWLRARAETEATFNLPANSVLCDINQLRTVNTARYRDQVLLNLNNVILSASIAGFVDKTEEENGFELYDWSKIRGTNGFDMAGILNHSRYCLGSVFGPNSNSNPCSIPKRASTSVDGIGVLDVEFTDAQALRFSAYSMYKGYGSEYKLQAVSFGDQDNNDCRFLDNPENTGNTDVEFEIDIEFVPK